MDLAVAAGMHAGRKAAKAIDAEDTSRAGLQGYVRALEESFAMKGLCRFAKAPEFTGGFARMFDGCPRMARDMANEMFVVDGEPVQPMKKSLALIVKEMGAMNLLHDVRGAMKVLWSAPISP